MGTVSLMKAPTEIAILLFEGITALDAVGPFEALSRLPSTRVRFVGTRAGPMRTGNDQLGICADVELPEVSAADVLLIPGGDRVGLLSLLSDPNVIDWIRRIDLTTKYTASVCTGSIVLAATGALNGRRAATHWQAKDALARYGATFVAERYVFDGKYVTSAGVSAGLDMALALCAELAGSEVAEAIQLSLQYDPKPLFAAGDPARATPERLRLVAEVLGR
jgi:transcriptional regulator GlxA family with amidase domain